MENAEFYAEGLEIANEIAIESKERNIKHINDVMVNGIINEEKFYEKLNRMIALGIMRYGIKKR